MRAAMTRSDPSAPRTPSLPAADTQGRIERLLAQNTALALQLSEQREAARASRSGQEIARLKAELDERFREIARLTEMLENRPDPAPGGSTAAIEELQAYAAELEHAYLSVTQSTSWRLTAPLRWGIRLLRGQSRPEPFAARYLDYSK